MRRNLEIPLMANVAAAEDSRQAKSRVKGIFRIWRIPEMGTDYLRATKRMRMGGFASSGASFVRPEQIDKRAGVDRITSGNRISRQLSAFRSGHQRDCEEATYREYESNGYAIKESLESDHRIVVGITPHSPTDIDNIENFETGDEPNDPGRATKNNT